jgi:imidazole glycerol-phosphate synthase subunit HisH
MKVAIIDYGAGNTQSVIYALDRLGVNPILTHDIDELISADRVIFPGVGHAASAMNRLNESGAVEVIKSLAVPVLGICLGMQLMNSFSEEGNVPGLGIFDGRIVQFAPTLKVPHMGWNTVDHQGDSLFDGIPSGSYFYHVHSYYLPLDQQHGIAQCTYQQPFTTALRKNNFTGVQFHPEKSGPLGEQLLRNFIDHG